MGDTFPTSDAPDTQTQVVPHFLLWRGGVADGDAVPRFALSDFGFFSEQFFNLNMKIFPFPVPAFASASQSVGSPLLNPAVEI